MGDYRSSSHVYWRCKYHIVWTPKFRFKILKGNVAKELNRSITNQLKIRHFSFICDF
ncbi:transposase [Vibrio cholerae]|nr:transposase [Vibrio cholerae]AOY49352.1 transposase [Vibrio cholerae]